LTSLSPLAPDAGSTGRTWGRTAGERPEERIIGGDACAPVAFAGARCACAALTRATADTWAEGKEEGKCGGALEEKGPIEERRPRLTRNLLARRKRNQLPTTRPYYFGYSRKIVCMNMQNTVLCCILILYIVNFK
jgi:hypothetical protein